MMANLHAMVRGGITMVNPDITCTYRTSTGRTVEPDGSMTPAFTDISGIAIQVQALTSGEILRTENRGNQGVHSMGVQGIHRSVYLLGRSDGVVRALLKGGDFMLFPLESDTVVRSWKIVEVVENWPDWSHVIVTLQEI